jgi:hypothetical protein
MGRRNQAERGPQKEVVEDNGTDQNSSGKDVDDP